VGGDLFLIAIVGGVDLPLTGLDDDLLEAVCRRAVEGCFLVVAVRHLKVKSPLGEETDCGRLH